MTLVCVCARCDLGVRVRCDLGVRVRCDLGVRVRWRTRCDTEVSCSPECGRSRAHWTRRAEIASEAAVPYFPPDSSRELWSRLPRTVETHTDTHTHTHTRAHTPSVSYSPSLRHPLVSLSVCLSHTHTHTLSLSLSFSLSLCASLSLSSSLSPSLSSLFLHPLSSLSIFAHCSFAFLIQQFQAHLAAGQRPTRVDPAFGRGVQPPATLL